MEKPVKGYVYVNRFTQMLDAIAKHERLLIVMDEGGIHGTSNYGASHSDNGEWIKFIKQQRKFGCSTLWIDQTEDGSIPPQLRKMAVYKFHKWRKGKVGSGTYFVEIYEKKNGEWEGIPQNPMIADYNSRTSLPFDSEHNASFRMDLPGKMTIKDVFDHLSDFPTSEVKGELLKVLKKINTELNSGGPLNKENSLVNRQKIPISISVKKILDNLDPKPSNREEINDRFKALGVTNKQIIKLMGITERYWIDLKDEWLSESS